MLYPAAQEHQPDDNAEKRVEAGAPAGPVGDDAVSRKEQRRWSKKGPRQSRDQNGD